MKVTELALLAMVVAFIMLAIPLLILQFYVGDSFEEDFKEEERRREKEYLERKN